MLHAAAAPGSNVFMSGRDGTDDWRGFLSSEFPESDIQKSIVFVIFYSDLSLAKHKNANSFYNSELAMQRLGKLLSCHRITPPI